MVGKNKGKEQKEMRAWSDLQHKPHANCLTQRKRPQDRIRTITFVFPNILQRIHLSSLLSSNHSAMIPNCAVASFNANCTFYFSFTSQNHTGSQNF